MKFSAKILPAVLCLSQLFDIAMAQQGRPRDGQYIGKSNTGDSVYAIVRSGKVISQIRVVNSCSIIWTVPWEDGYSFSAKLQNMSC
jgi:hypothetical protein